MRAIGEVQNIGGTYLVSRSALLRYLEAVDSADDLTAAHRERLLFAEPVPRPRSLKVDLPEDLHAVMLRDLPPEILVAGRDRKPLRRSRAQRVFHWPRSNQDPCWVFAVPAIHSARKWTLAKLPRDCQTGGRRSPHDAMRYLRPSVNAVPVTYD
ncbi:hypothetical protein D1Y84_14215 [Acidipila sp. EB88]|nr:hypothetical protein D1Y84_14215 [Acidipila sp. EB88]